MIHSIPVRRRMGDATSTLISGGIGAGVSLATSAAALWMNSIQLSHNADSATTAIVNGLATQLTNVKNAYFALSTPTCAEQRAALNAIDEGIAWLQSPSACGNPNYGAAGDRCISERAFPGAKYSYIDQIRDPIANDPRMANAACDTGAQIFLPSLSTGAYAPTNLTADGGSAATGTAAASNSAAAGVNANAQFTAGIPAWAIVAAVAFGGLFLFGGRSRA